MTDPYRTEDENLAVYIGPHQRWCVFTPPWVYCNCDLRVNPPPPLTPEMREWLDAQDEYWAEMEEAMGEDF